MINRYAGIAALLIGFVLIAHAVLAFTKMRWVTGLLEVIAAGALLWHWWLARPVTPSSSPAAPRS